MSDASPINTLEKSDPGDDVISRFRYQFSDVAISALRLISEPNWAKSIICENFEDYIIQNGDCSFTAVQVKTKERHLAKLKLTDTAVEKSLRRFIQLNNQFAGKFREFVFVTNHDMWTETTTENNLPWLLDELKKSPSIKSLRKTNPKKIAVLRLSECTGAKPEEVIETLLMTRCNPRCEDIKTITKAVENAVNECETCSELQYPTVIKIAENLVDAVSRASTKEYQTFDPALYAAEANFEDALSKSSLEGKIIDRKIVEELIEEHISPLNEPLVVEGLIPQDRLPNGLSKMIRKMAAGGVQLNRINHTQDLVRSFESLEIKWTTRFGAKRAREMTQDLLARTLTDCIEAQNEAEEENNSYGANQFALLKRMLESRYVREKETLYGCKADHLIGAAGILTEQCKVWWSDEFELSETKQ